MALTRPMIAVVVARLFASAATAAAGEELTGSAWLRNPPQAESAATGWVDVPSEDAYEVVASREDWAVILLEEKPILPLSEQMARSLAGDHFVADPRKKPYLVRAVCGHGAGSPEHDRAGDGHTQRSLGEPVVGGEERSGDAPEQK